MNKLLIPVILSIIILLGFSTVYGAEHDEIIIPSWIKIIAGAWYNGELSDAEYVGAMEFLIEANIININGTNNAELEAEALEWKSKYETAESQRVSQSQSDAAAHQALYDETEKNADDRIKIIIDKHDTEISEYTDIIHQRDAEIEDLKKQLNDKLK